MDRPRPLAVTILGCVYIAVGVIGFAAHLPDLRAEGALRFDGLGIELIRVLALVAGVFLLRGADWARWLAIAWIAFHVVISAFHSPVQFAVHCVFCIAIAWFLLRPPAARYFRTG